MSYPQPDRPPDDVPRNDRQTINADYSKSFIVSVRNFALLAAAGSLLLSVIELVDVNIQLTRVFENAGERLQLAAYSSLNIVGATILGVFVGVVAYLLCRLSHLIERIVAGRKRPRLWSKLASVLVSAGIGAIVLNQFVPVNNFVNALIREAEKIEGLNQPLLNHERATSYLIVMAVVLSCWGLSAITQRFGRANAFGKTLWTALLIGGIFAAYYVDSRVELQLYEHSLHLTAFLASQVLSIALVAIISRGRVRGTTAGRKRRSGVATGIALLLLMCLIFTFARFDRNHNLKTQVFYRTTQTKQFVGLFQWVLDFDRDGYSPFLGGGDCDDRRADINPSRPELPGDGLDNNCAAGDLTGQSLDDWNRERGSRHINPQPGAQLYNVIYVFVDALRADHLGLYGYSRNTSPNLDRLGSRASVFLNAFTPAPNTFEALPKFTESAYWDAHLETWPEILKRNGYDTFLFPRRISTLLRHIKGMTVVKEARVPTFSESVDKAIEVLGAQPSDRPFAAYLYSTDPHRPYHPHAEFNFGSSNTDLYDGEIAYTDAQLGKLVAWLAGTSRLEKTMIVIMADHGESLGERGVYKHSTQLYNEQAHIPLIIYLPSLGPRRIAEYVSSVDLGVTILNAVGLDYPAACDGVSLVPLMRDDARTLAYPPIYAEQTGQEVSPYVQPEQNVFPETKKYMVITQDGFKLIYGRNVHTFELFDLKNDPREERNLFDREPAKASELWGLLARFIDVVTASRPRDADESQYHFGPAARDEQ
ncbi:MAG TPA: sulfatase-like hydrolase/transferase [Blastocatellia bacterium]|nr:sulfatase-like hydrolase/transferase [Blastocatellia bacterium]